MNKILYSWNDTLYSIKSVVEELSPEAIDELCELTQDGEIVENCYTDCKELMDSLSEEYVICEGETIVYQEGRFESVPSDEEERVSLSEIVRENSEARDYMCDVIRARILQEFKNAKR